MNSIYVKSEDRKGLRIVSKKSDVWFVSKAKRFIERLWR